jgi:hypothetical protein
VATILSERQAALARTDEVPEPSGEAGASPAEFKQRVLDRGYLGL